MELLERVMRARNVDISFTRFTTSDVWRVFSLCKCRYGNEDAKLLFQVDDYDDDAADADAKD